MTYAVILVAASGGKNDKTALALAASLAARHGSLAEVLITAPPPLADLGSWGVMAGIYASGEALDELRRVDAETRARIRTGAEAAAKGAGIPFGPGDGVARMVIREHAQLPWLALAQALPLVDLTVIGDDQTRGAGLADGALAETLMAARGPVLVAQAETLDPEGVSAIAWDGSLQAGRAVRAALPLLREARNVVILQDPAGLDPDERGAADPGRLSAYLRLHGIRSSEAMAVAGGADGSALIAAARERDASLLVAGAYGHARLRERILGGATRVLLGAHGGPSVLLAH